MEFTEPLDPDSAMGKYLQTFGPGPYHLAFGVSDIAGKAAEAGREGQRNAGRKRDVPQRGGYMTANIAAASALGYPFQIAEG